MEVASGLAELGELSLGSTDVSGLAGLSQGMNLLAIVFSGDERVARKVLLCYSIE